MTKVRVLVVGASIAGPTAAYWLAKAGAHVTVIERFPKLRTNGQNIDIRTAGVSVMREMPGMEVAVRSKKSEMEGMSLVDHNGRLCGTIKPTGNPDQQSLISEYEILRGELSQILFDLTKDNENIKYVFGEQVASIQQQEKEDGPIKVEFVNGLPTSEYDLVVACDGATSRTRAIGLGCGARDYIHPTNCWGAYCTIKQDILEGGKNSQGYSAPGGRTIFIGPDPAGINRVGFMAVNPRENRDVTLPFRNAMKEGDDALKQFVARHFRGIGWKADEIIKGMLETDDCYASEVVQVKVPSIYKGRFALVGDAGYAPGFTGTGTTLAIAGAYILAGEVGKHKGDLAAGLRGYEERMKPIIAEMQKVPPFVTTFMAPQTAWGIWLRNIIFAFFAWTNIFLYAPKIFGNAFGNSEEYKLPEYEWVA